MRGRRFCAIAATLVVLQVAFTGRVNDPTAVIVAAMIGAAVGTAAIGPRPRELGRWWGTLSQKIAVDERDNAVLAELRLGRQHATAAPAARLRELVRIAKSELRLRLGLSYLALALSGLLALAFFGGVSEARGPAVRLVAQAVMVPVPPTWDGRGGVRRATACACCRPSASERGAVSVWRWPYMPVPGSKRRRLAQASLDIEAALGEEGPDILAVWAAADEDMRRNFVTWVAWADGRWRAERIDYLRTVAARGELVYPIPEVGSVDGG